MEAEALAAISRIAETLTTTAVLLAWVYAERADARAADNRAELANQRADKLVREAMHIAHKTEPPSDNE